MRLGPGVGGNPSRWCRHACGDANEREDEPCSKRVDRGRPHRHLTPARRVGDQVVIRFEVASNSRRRGADGIGKRATRSFVSVNCWGRPATGVGAALGKGTAATAVGHVDTSEYDDRDGSGGRRSRCAPRRARSSQSPRRSSNTCGTEQGRRADARRGRRAGSKATSRPCRAKADEPEPCQSDEPLPSCDEPAKTAEPARAGRAKALLCRLSAVGGRLGWSASNTTDHERHYTRHG